MGKHTRGVHITHKYTVIDLKSYYFRKEAQSLTETDTSTECKESRNPQVSHRSPVSVLTLQDRRGVTGKGALLAECGAPGTREGGKVDVRLRRWAAVHWLTAHYTVPHSMRTNQICFRLRRGQNRQRMTTIYKVRVSLGSLENMTVFHLTQIRHCFAEL